MQTLPDATPPVGKIHPVSKIAVTLEPIQRLGALQDLDYLKKVQYSLFCEWKHNFKPFGRGGATKIF